MDMENHSTAFMHKHVVPHYLASQTSKLKFMSF